VDGNVRAGSIDLALSEFKLAGIQGSKKLRFGGTDHQCDTSWDQRVACGSVKVADFIRQIEEQAVVKVQKLRSRGIDLWVEEQSAEPTLVHLMIEKERLHRDFRNGKRVKVEVWSVIGGTDTPAFGPDFRIRCHR
jgi:hypothetical protein